MGHIINPNIYRLGKIVPWLSSGFKRNKNERSKVANEDFLIYNFTRNFFYKKVYKKVVGKINKLKLKVKNRRRARKSKRKRKFGRTSLLHHWIIKYSHLTITRFNKTFQLNLFFFDRELQKRYRVRYKRKVKKKKGSLHQQKMLKLKKLLAYKLRVKKGYNNIYLATPIQLQNKPITKVVPTIQGLSKELSKDVSKVIKQKQNRIDKINYSLARDLRRKGQKQERVYIYKDNTFENNKVKDRLQVLPNALENVTYKQLYSKKIFKKIHKITYKKNIKYVASFKFPKIYHYVDSFHFKNQARYANNYLFVKGTQPKQYYDQKKKYIEVMRKTNTLGVKIKQKTANIVKRIDNQIIDLYENQVDMEKYQPSVNKLKRRELIGELKQNELWKKHYLRIKIKRRLKKQKYKGKGKKARHKLPHKYAKYIKKITNEKK